MTAKRKTPKGVIKMGKPVDMASRMLELQAEEDRCQRLRIAVYEAAYNEDDLKILRENDIVQHAIERVVDEESRKIKDITDKREMKIASFIAVLLEAFKKGGIRQVGGGYKDRINRISEELETEL